MRTIVAALAGYFIGTIPSADIAARLASRRRRIPSDLRDVGTGNPGALNAAKTLGWRWGALVLAGDIGKGVLASVIGRRIGGANRAYAAGTASVVGHCAPVWSGFRGGKGVATSAGTSLVCFPAYAPADIGLATALTALSRGRGEIATCVTSAVFVLAATYWWATGRENAWGPKATVGLPLYALASSALIIYRFVTAPPPDAAAVPLAAAETGAIPEEALA
ncbi:MAG TPA: glycerol-3-phosphate acyltransferase [Dehalococcoidia bacterium]